MAYGYAERNEGEQASFNMAIATLQRIHMLLIDANNFSRQRLYDMWKLTLDSVYQEVRPFLNKKEIEEDPGTDKIDEEIQKSYEEFDTIRRNVNSMFKTKFPIHLKKWEQVLRKLMDKHDLLIPKKDDPRYAALR